MRKPWKLRKRIVYGAHENSMVYLNGAAALSRSGILRGETSSQADNRLGEPRCLQSYLKSWRTAHFDKIADGGGPLDRTPRLGDRFLRGGPVAATILHGRDRAADVRYPLRKSQLDGRKDNRHRRSLTRLA